MNEPLSLGYNIILYRTRPISNDCAEKLVLKMKEKLRERRFGVLKTLKTHARSFQGLCPLDPRRGVAPGPHQGPLSGPLDPTPLRCSARYPRFALLGHKTIFVQHPAVTNPAHAHEFLLSNYRESSFRW